MILGGTRAASNYANAQNLKVYGNKLNDIDIYNDPKVANLINRQSMAIEELNMLQLYCSRFKWESDNDSMPCKYIEYMMFYNGILAFFKSENYGYLLLPCSVASVNVYGEPEQVTVTLPIGTKATIHLEKGEYILLRDNSALNIPFLTVEHYARMISDTSRTCDVYARAMKKPLIVTGNFKNKESKRKFINNIQSNETFVIVDESNLEGMGEVNVMQNTSHNSEDLKGLYMYKNNLYNECIAKLGITTPTIIKQAQVNKDEINKNDVMANIILQNTFECREAACKEIYELSGISLTCTMSPELKPEEPEDEIEEKGEE